MTSSSRRTKIVATLGPATDSPRVLKKILSTGVDIVRLNYSHGTADDQARRADALTFKDRIDIREAVALQADFIAVSFPRSAHDMLEARQLVKDAGGHASLVAKIERAEALKALDEIIGASDAVMVARGDLGVE